VIRGVTDSPADESRDSVADGTASVPNLPATVFQRLGLDAWKLIYPYQGLRQRLIGPEGAAPVGHEILA
jgi:hypothetical protein